MIKNEIEKYTDIQHEKLDGYHNVSFYYRINKGVEEKNNGSDVAKHLMCNDKILTIDDWKNILRSNHIEKNVFNIEHTERQLLLYHLFNMTGDRWCNNTDGVEYIKWSASIYGRSLLIYTNGAPCYEEDEAMIDNGGMCCWNLYRLVPSDISIQVYFSKLEFISTFRDEHCLFNITNCKRPELVELITGMSTYNDTIRDIYIKGGKLSKNYKEYLLQNNEINWQRQRFESCQDIEAIGEELLWQILPKQYTEQKDLLYKLLNDNKAKYNKIKFEWINIHSAK